ncbi:MAG: ROK family transcriptional regulator [Specibacter sp.]
MRVKGYSKITGPGSREPRMQAADAVSRAEILGLLGQVGALSRSEIARSLGLGPATVTAQVRRLMADGHVRERPADGPAGQGATAPGRPRVPVELVADSAAVMGLSVEPAAVSIVTMSIDGRIRNARTVGFDAAADPVGQLAALVAGQRAALEHPDKVAAIGVSVSGAVDRALSTVRISATLGWADFALGAELRDAVGLPVFVANDLFALSTREVSFGLGRNREDFLLLGLGAGVGMGIISRRKVFSGAAGRSTEFGHMSVDPEGPLCLCGNRGCLQVYAGLGQIIDAAPGLGGMDGTIEDLHAALATGNPELARFMDDVGHRLGRSVGGIVNLLGIATVIVTGRTTSLWPALGGGFARGLKETVLTFLHPVDVLVKDWTEYEGAVGAAGLALHTAVSLNVPLRPVHA